MFIPSLDGLGIHSVLRLGWPLVASCWWGRGQGGTVILKTIGGKGGRKDGILVLTATRREQAAVPTNLFRPAVAETYAIHNGHLPIQRLLLPPELLLHLASFLDCLGDSIVVI